MILKFEGGKWPLKHLGAIVDNDSLVCVSAPQSIEFLKQQRLDQVLQWALRTAEKIQIHFTDPKAPTPLNPPVRLIASNGRYLDDACPVCKELNWKSVLPSGVTYCTHCEQAVLE